MNYKISTSEKEMIADRIAELEKQEMKSVNFRPVESECKGCDGTCDSYCYTVS